MVGLSDWFPGLRPNTPYSSRWQSFLSDLQQQGVTVDPSQSGGYNPRSIRGTNTPSLHASDRAYDVNWGANPEGSVQDEADIARQHLERDMGGSTAPITQLHPMLARETAARHGMRWGGDFRGRSPDPMHFEVAGPAPGGMPGRSLVAHAGMTPPSGATSMVPAGGGSGLLQGIMSSIMGSAQAQPAAPQGGRGGFSPEMLTQIMRALQPQAQPPAQASRGASFTAGAQGWPPRVYPSGADPVATPMAMPNPETDWMMPPQGGGPTPPPAPMGVPQMGGPQMPGAPPPTPSAMDTNWLPPQAQPQSIEAPLPITPMDPEAVISGAQAAQQANNPPPQPGGGLLAGMLPAGVSQFADRITNHPLLPALLATAGTAPGGNWGSNAASALYQGQRGQRERTEYQRQQGQRAAMDRVWAEAFPNGQPNLQHPLLAGQTPQVAAMIAGLGPEAALPLLAKSAMDKKQLELKDIGGQGVIFDPRTGQIAQVPGTQGGKPPSGYRWAEGGQQLEPIPGGPGEHIASEVAGRLAIMKTAQTGFPAAREFFTRRWGAGEAARNAFGGSVVAPEYDRHRRTVRLAVEGSLRAMTGAAAPQSEVDQYMEMFMPKVVDPPETAAQKMRLLEGFMRNAEEIVTRGRRPAGGQQQPGTRLRYDPATGELVNAN